MTKVQAGELIDGKYLVERTVGRGGEGVVVTALHVRLGCRVALKLLRAEASREPETLARFVREGQLLARIRSEHVVRVLDVGRLPSAEPVLVMEYLAGVDLAALLHARGPLPVVEAVDLVRQACCGVSAAHRLGIVHRDLKPANLFLAYVADAAPLVKVLDFGFALEESSALASDGAVMGSPPFMAPELLRAERPGDARSDIWSLGAVLFALLAGRSPFERRYLSETCGAILCGDVPELRAVRPDVPRSLAAVVSRCLASDPERRFQSMRELAAELALPFGATNPFRPESYTTRACAIRFVPVSREVQEE